MKKIVTISIIVFCLISIVAIVVGAIYQNQKGGSASSAYPEKKTQNKSFGVTTTSQSQPATQTPKTTTTPAPTTTTTKTTTTTTKTTTKNYLTVTTAEVAKHNTATDCWYIVSGKVYNITAYIKGTQHPAGQIYLTDNCGVDATTAFTKIPHTHSAFATSLLNTYYLVDLNGKIEVN